MPQIDLSPLFTPPPKDRTPCSDPFLVQTWKDRAHQPGQPSRLKLTLSQITNIGFVLAACLGAVVSALYFIRGAELFQGVSAWPRELFYGRPVSRPTAAIMATMPKGSKDESGDPFSPTNRLLSPDSLIMTRSRSNGASYERPFSRLDMPAPGGDALSRSLIQNGFSPQSVPASAQSTTRSATQTAVAKVEQQAAPTANAITGKSKTGNAPTHSTGAKLKSRVPSRQISSKPTAETTLPIKSNVAPPGSHIGASSSSSVSAASSLGIGRPTGSASHASDGAGAGNGLSSAHGIGRLGGH